MPTARSSPARSRRRICVSPHCHSPHVSRSELGDEVVLVVIVVEGGRRGKSNDVRQRTRALHMQKVVLRVLVCLRVVRHLSVNLRPLLPFARPSSPSPSLRPAGTAPAWAARLQTPCQTRWDPWGLRRWATHDPFTLGERDSPASACRASAARDRPCLRALRPARRHRWPRPSGSGACAGRAARTATTLRWRREETRTG